MRLAEPALTNPFATGPPNFLLVYISKLAQFQNMDHLKENTRKIAQLRSTCAYLLKAQQELLALF